MVVFVLKRRSEWHRSELLIFIVWETCNSRWLEVEDDQCVIFQPMMARHLLFLNFDFISDSVLYSLMTMICTTRQIPWIWLLTRFDSHPMVHIFYFFFSFLWFLYFNCFKFQKIIEKSFLVQKIWKNYEKYFWLFSFWFLFFHNLILCFGIFLINLHFIWIILNV